MPPSCCSGVENGKIFPFAEEFVAAQDRLENECREIGVNLQKIPKRSIRIPVFDT